MDDHSLMYGALTNDELENGYKEKLSSNMESFHYWNCLSFLGIRKVTPPEIAAATAAKI